MYEDRNDIPQENQGESTQTAAGTHESPEQHAHETAYTYAYSQNKAPEPPRQQEKKQGGMKRVIASALVFGLVAGVVMYGVNAGLSAVKKSAKADAGTASETPAVVERAELSKGASSSSNTPVSGASSVSEVSASALPAVVAITSKTVQEVHSFFFGGQTQKYESDASGSGIIVGQTDTELLIATNYHVVSGTEGLSVAFVDNAAASAQVKGTDSENDLAVIAVKLEDVSAETLKAIRVIEIGDSNALVVGEQVVAIGNALGYGQSVTSGWVSALNREVTVEGSTKSLIQTDAAINPGNSGGALLNMAGQLIGINEAKYSSDQVEGMGYAIPISVAEPILNDLMNRETRYKVDETEAGYLGVSCMSVSDEAMSYYGMPAGAYVAEVTQNGPASKAGVQQGDIITSIDGEAVSSSDELVERMSYYAKGDTVELKISRANNGAYEEKSISVTLGAKAELAAQS